MASAIHRVIDAWNAAERDVKLAEQCLGEVSLPAIMEMRYAGRRIVDGLDMLLNDQTGTVAIQTLNSAESYLRRARHDAIDAVTAMVSRRLEKITIDRNLSDLVRDLPGFHENIKNLLEVKRLIAESRADRHLRQAIYDQIAEERLAQILNFGEELQFLDFAAPRNFWEARKSYWSAALTALVGLVAALSGLVLALVK